MAAQPRSGYACAQHNGRHPSRVVTSNLQNLSGPMPPAAAEPAAARWSQCRWLASGLPGAVGCDEAPSWPPGLAEPFDTPRGDRLPSTDSLRRPDELAALGVAVVPCLVLAGRRPPLALPVPAGADRQQACRALAERAGHAGLALGPHDAIAGLAHALSHDVRGPLLGAGRLIDLALGVPEVGLSERQLLQQASRAIDNAGARLDALRRFLQLDREPPATQPVDVCALVPALAAALQAAWPHARRRLEVAPGLCVRADPGQLEQALRELLDNAFKFSHRVDAPDIRVELHRGPGYAVLAVSDNGPGFSAASAAQLFGLFQRQHLASEFPGLGAGLALVRRVAERHGGWAWADLGVPGRTTFLLALPEALPNHG